jgi:Type III secretion system lipoprotein chaperone (YscW)
VILLVDVVVEGAERPPPGSPIRVEVRDTSLADTEAPLLVESAAEVTSGSSSRLGSVELEIPDGELDPRRRFDVFAHVDVDANGAFTPGDFITTRSYPLPQDGAAGEVKLELAVVRI